MLLLPAFLTSLWLLAPALATSLTSPAVCPEGWVDAQLDLGCLLFKASLGYSWDQANNHCNLEGNASLVEIITPEQHEYIIVELQLLADNGKKHDWWTSGTDVGKQGRWFWVQSLELVEEFVWGDDEPNTPTNNCMFLSAARHFMAYDRNCASEMYPICQIK